MGMSRYAIVVGSKEYRRTAYALCGHAADAIADIGVEKATNGEMERRICMRRNYGSGFTELHPCCSGSSRYA